MGGPCRGAAGAATIAPASAEGDWLVTLVVKRLPDMFVTSVTNNDAATLRRSIGPAE
jgi:hypothetical protein